MANKLELSKRDNTRGKPETERASQQQSEIDSDTPTPESNDECPHTTEESQEAPRSEPNSEAESAVSLADGESELSFESVEPAVSDDGVEEGEIADETEAEEAEAGECLSTRMDMWREERHDHFPYFLSYGGDGGKSEL